MNKDMKFLISHSKKFDNIVERLSDYLEFRKFLQIDEKDSLFLQLREELDNLNHNFFDFIYYLNLKKKSEIK